MLFHRRVKKPILSGRWLGRRAPNLPHEQRGKPQIPAACSSEPANKSTDTANETHIGDESVFSLIFVLFFSAVSTSKRPRHYEHVPAPCFRASALQSPCGEALSTTLFFKLDSFRFFLSHSIPPCPFILRLEISTNFPPQHVPTAGILFRPSATKHWPCSGVFDASSEGFPSLNEKGA